MSSASKNKYMGKPFIKKIYETHKKWLGSDSKSKNSEPKQTVDFKSQTEEIESLVKSDLDCMHTENLKSVINSFDRILDEYSSISSEKSKEIAQQWLTCKKPDKNEKFRASKTVFNDLDSDASGAEKRAPLPIKLPNYLTYKVVKKEPLSPTKQDLPEPKKTLPKSSTKIPKLVKAKTCSIIESKCILKKTGSNGNVSFDSKSLNGDNVSQKTKSMSNLCEFDTTPFQLMSVVAISTKTSKPEQKFDKQVPKCPENTPTHKKFTPPKEIPIPPKQNGINQPPVIESPVKVKDLVKRLNSLTETQDTNATTSQISKAVSSTNLSLSKKLGSVSKIPVNASLRKSFPSTPCHLDKLDNSSSGLEGRRREAELSKAKSVQNLAKGRMSLVKNANGLGKSTPDLLKSKSFQTKGLIKEGSVKYLSGETDKAKYVSKTYLKPTDVKPKLTLNKTSSKSTTDLTAKSTKPTPKPLSLKPTKDIPIKPKTPPARPLQDSKQSNTKTLIKRTEVNPLKIKSTVGVEPKEALKGPKDKSVYGVVKQYEGAKDVEKKKIVRNQTFKKVDDVVSVRKIGDGLESKKSKVSDNYDKGNKKSAAPLIKLDLQKSKEFLNKVLPKNDGSFYLDPEDFLDVKNVPKTTSTKDSDYNSDDSGNISNDIDCDDAASSVKSKASIESLTTVLDVSNNSISTDASIENYTKKKEAKPKIFFRTGVVSQLETQRDERLAGVVISLQAQCRGFLARKRLQQKKLQDLAVRCIQRNVRKFMLVRDWPWWRLLVRVTPLLNVHRTEEELRARTEELEALKMKLQKLENERSSLKYDNDKLESKLSEMTADLADEHSTATLAAERLDAETSERLRLEKELNDSKQKNRELTQASERLELELLYAKSDLNGICEEDEDSNEGDGVYKQRYERALKELEFTKRRLQQQHEDDLEQLVGLKKQLEKKLSDAYEEAEEQRQVVGTWKRKVQKLNGEMNDLKLLLEEQSSRNNLLEKKQRKYDSEASMLQDELKKEKQTKDRLSREKEVLVAEKYALDSYLADTKLELELKEEKLNALQREFDEITCGGKTEEEVTILRKQKIDCERRLQDQEEELDELAGQVQLLEQAKLRLEMTLESMRKEAKKEAQLREEEIEEARCNAQKKVKALEQQLENEHEERTILLREKHELERRLQAAADMERQDRAGDEALLQRLKRDLKRTKALLRDTQAQLERQKAETPGKNMIRQLRNQLEDLECARAIAMKTKQSLEQELTETQTLLEEAHRQKNEAEDRSNVLLREKSDLQSQLEENEEELAEVLKKYKTTVQQMSLDQMALQEQVSLVSELEVERNHLKEQLAELTSRLESAESMGGASSNLLYKRSELKVKELESKLDLEQTTRSRLEVQIARLKETVDKLQSEIAASKSKEQQSQDQLRKLQRQLREVKEELNKSLSKESEVIIKKKELEKRCESLEAECATSRTDLRLALKRIEDLQSAIQGELEDSISNESDSEEESYGSDESVNTFLASHKLGSPTKDRSLTNDVRRPSSSSASRSSTSSNLGKDSSYA